MDKILHQGYQWRRRLTNRTNATARDNLMTGASLEYSGYYVGNLLYHVDIHGSWQSSTTRYSATSYYLVIEDNDIIYPQGDYGKYVGRPVRCVFSS